MLLPTSRALRLLAGFAAFLAVLVFTLPDDADARRIGGGRSSGSRPSMSKPYTRSTPAPSSTMRRSAPSAVPSSPMRQTPSATTPRSAQTGGSMMGGIGGMLGGVLAGTLLGSLLFGDSGGAATGAGGVAGAPAGAGASGGAGFGFIDLLLLGVVAYFIYKFVAKRRAARQEYAGVPYDNNYGNDGWQNQTRSDVSFGQNGFSQGGNENILGGVGGTLPPNFDMEDFVKGARAAYLRLNASWDRRDMQDIAQFTTPAFLAELIRQKQEDPTPGHTEIVLINTVSVVEGKVDNRDEIVSVFFDVLLREEPGQQTPTNIHEVWHFARPVGGGGSWKLDGIQQA